MQHKKGFLLDNNICVYIAKAWTGDTRYFSVSRHFRLHADKCYIAATTKQEFVTWIEGNGITDDERVAAEKLLRHFNDRTMPFDHKTSTTAGKLSARLNRDFGRNLKKLDTQIAAVAIEKQLILVTHDRDFEKIPSLNLVDWVAIQMSQSTYLQVLKVKVLRVSIFIFPFYTLLLLITTSTKRSIILAITAFIGVLILLAYTIIEIQLTKARA